MSRVASNRAVPRERGFAGFHSPTAAVLMLLVATLLAYWPALRGGFLWDDDMLLTNNPLVKDPRGLLSIWFTSQPIDYWPVTNSTFWLEWRVWGLDTFGYHVMNVALHITASLLVWIVLRQLSIPGAFLAALLFVVHPVNVEAVAWIAQRKTLLALIFFLLSILCYLRFYDADERRPSGRPLSGRPSVWYGLSLGAFALSLLSKGSTATLPLILLLVVWWRRKRITRLDLLRTIPFFALAVPLVFINMWFQTHGTGEVIRSAGLFERLLGAGAAIWFYLSKALLPVNLMFVYPQWTIEPLDPRWWLPLLGVVAASVLLWRSRDTRLGRPLGFAWAFFCLALLPVLGLVDVYFMRFSLVADHYQNIALVSVTALVAATWHTWYEKIPEPALMAAGIVVVVLVLISRGLAANYRDSETLWRTAVRDNLACWMAYNNLAATLTRANQPEQAVPLLETALQLQPDYAEAENNLGSALMTMNRLPEAVEHLQRSLKLKPDYSLAHNNLGRALLRFDRVPEAIDQFDKALAVQPEDADAHNNLAGALLRAGRADEALTHCRRAIELAPDFAAAQMNLGDILLGGGRPQEAVPAFAAAAKIKPDFAEAHDHWGLALLDSGQTEQAIAQFREALQRKPDLGEAQNHLAIALLSLNRPQEAIPHLEQLARDKPNDPAVLNNLGSALLNTGRPADAVGYLQRAVNQQPDQAEGRCNLGRALLGSGQAEEAATEFQAAIRLRPDFAVAWANLADAEAAANHLEKAVVVTQKALDLARATNQTALIGQMQGLLTRLQARAAEQENKPAPPVLPPP